MSMIRKMLSLCLACVLAICFTVPSLTVSAATDTTTSASVKQVEITGSTVNVRAGAGTSYTKVGSTVKGRKYTYLAQKKATNRKIWYQIQFTSAKKGWVIGTYSKLLTTSTTAATTQSTTDSATVKQVEITGSTVNVRAGAGISSSKIGSTVKGKKYTYLAQKKDSNGKNWYQIQFTTTQKGWVISTLSKLVTTSTTTTTTNSTTASASVKQVEITGSTVNVRSGAGTSATKIGSTIKGKKYTYLAEKKDANGKIWYQIQFTATQKGWVISTLSKLITTSTTSTTTKSTTDSASVKQVEITGSTVNVRAGAGTSYAQIGSTVKGRKYTYLAQKKATNGKVWYQIQFTATKKGWVIGTFSKLVTTSTTSTTTKSTTDSASVKQVEITGSTVNVRANAGLSCTKIGSTVKGRKYIYLAQKKDANGKNWYQIQFTSTKKGWVIGTLSKVVTATIPTSTLVRIRDHIPTVFVDLKYATKDNFTGMVIYDFTDPYLRYGTVKKLAKVQEELLDLGYSLKIWDAYRPPAAQFKLWNACPNPVYVANPNTGFSSHSRGNTVDVTLVMADGSEIEMPTGFDDFSALADRDYSDVSSAVAKNAKLLENLMKKHGFNCYFGEWWHYSDSVTYSVIDG